MASWILHLRIAEAVSASWPTLPPGLLSIGSIAPDSGVPDEKWMRYSPPPEVTHFYRGKTEEYRINDVSFYRDYLSRAQPGSPAHSFYSAIYHTLSPIRSGAMTFIDP